MGVVSVILGEAVSRRGFLKMLGIGAGSVAVPWSTITTAAEKAVPNLFSVLGDGSYVPVNGVPSNAIKTAFGYVTPIDFAAKSDVYTSIIYDKSLPLTQELAKESGIFTAIMKPIKKALADGTITREEASMSPHMPAIKQAVLRLKDAFTNSMYPSLGETFKSPESIRLIYGFDVNAATVNTPGIMHLQNWIGRAIDSGQHVCPEVINLYGDHGVFLVNRIRNRMDQSSPEVRARLEKTVDDMNDIMAKNKAAEQEQVNRGQQQQRDEDERWEITKNPHAFKAHRSPRMDWGGGNEDDDYNRYSMASESKRIIDALVGS